MIKTEKLTIDGNTAEGICIASPGGEGHPNMLVITAKNGYIMCGYLNLEAAASFGDAACVVSGSTVQEQLENPVKALTPEAEKLGIRIGMTGAEACALLNK